MVALSKFANNLQERFDSIHQILIDAVIESKKSIVNGDVSLKEHEESINAAGQQQIRADLVAEQSFIDYISDNGVNGILFSEESGVKKIGDVYSEDSVAMLLDPLDGSNNFSKGIQIGCISLAYGPLRRNPKMGDLDSAILLDLYSPKMLSTDGYNPVKMNDKPLKIYKGRKLRLTRKNKIHLYSYNPKVKEYFKSFSGQFSLESKGSVAWELAMVASKQVQLFVDLRNVVKVHDFAAAKILIEQMGGYVMVLSGSDVDELPINQFKKGHSIIASHDYELLKCVAEDIEEITSTKPRMILNTI